MPVRNIDWNVPKPTKIKEVTMNYSDVDFNPYKNFKIKPINNYLSQHSDKEYDLLLKAFLQLGEECDELRSQNESLTMQIEDSREDFYELQDKYDTLVHVCEITIGTVESYFNNEQD